MEFSQQDLRDRVITWHGQPLARGDYRVYTDTSDFYRIDYGDVVVLGGRPYLILNNEREGRFGIDEQQKFWVKRALDLADGTRKVMKLVFHERFQARVGPLVFDCVRSPAKEARVLEMVAGHPGFMHGFSVADENQNVVRVIDFIKGQKLDVHVQSLRTGHEEYFHAVFPVLLRKFREACRALRELHDRSEIHGDVRRDHIIIDRETGVFKWIDFDFVYSHRESKFAYDLFGLGNILAFLAGGGDVTVQDLRGARPEAFARITEGDLNIIFQNRVMNLRKVFPYVPEALNRMLMHFTLSAEVFYETTAEFLDDLALAEAALASG
ncbi:MAG: hypothetical protein Kow0025_14460 [Thermodesulfovibrionales bacterium]